MIELALTTLRPFTTASTSTSAFSTLFCTLPLPLKTTMKSMVVAALLFVASACAQGISIAIPAEGDTIMAGEPTDVELDFPVSA